MKLDLFTQAYLEAIQFTECHCDNEELENSDGFSEKLIARAIADCAKFQKDNEALLDIYYESFGPEYAGHDFWLNRNGHGAGFWDRSIRHEDNASFELLSDACHNFGMLDVGLDEDNLICFG